MEEAKLLARARRQWLKAEKEAAAAHRRFSARELGGMLDAASPVATAAPEAKVVQLVPQKVGRAVRPAPDAAPASVTRLPIRPEPQAADESPRERFRRALELELALAQGRPVTPDQRRWLEGYQTTPQYRTERALWEDHGDAIFG